MIQNISSSIISVDTFKVKIRKTKKKKEGITWFPFSGWHNINIINYIVIYYYLNILYFLYLYLFFYIFFLSIRYHANRTLSILKESDSNFYYLIFFKVPFFYKQVFWRSSICSIKVPLFFVCPLFYHFLYVICNK